MSRTSKVPMGQKIAFGFGMLANQMFPAILGKRNTKDHIQPEKPKSSTKTTIKIPKMAGNIWLANIPKPKAIFCPIGTLLVVDIIIKSY